MYIAGSFFILLNISISKQQAHYNLILHGNLYKLYCKKQVIRLKLIYQTRFFAFPLIP